jgi:hypothetical protein
MDRPPAREKRPRKRAKYCNQDPEEIVIPKGILIVNLIFD